MTNVNSELPLGGTHVLLVTPFDTDGRYDEASMHRLINNVVANGAVGVIALGTTGEGFTLLPDERATIVQSVRRMTTVPLTVGVGADSTAAACELARVAEAEGANCLMVPAPMFFDSGPSSQISHFTTVADSVKVPIMIYDGAGGIAVDSAVIAAAADEHPNIRYVKMALPDPARVVSHLAAAPHLEVFAGDDLTLLPSLLAGASASAVATGNLLAKELREIHAAVAADDLDAAWMTFINRVAPSVVVTSVPKNQFIARFKILLQHRGTIKNSATRPPLPRPTSDAEVLAAARALDLV